MIEHKMPLCCKIHRFFFGYSPSIMWISCKAGVKKRIKKCKGCEHHVIEPEEILAAFQRGVKEGRCIKIKKGLAQ